MKRSTSLAAAALAATLLAACGGSGGKAPAAAVVNGIEITAQDVVDELDAIQGNDAYMTALDDAAQQQGQQAIYDEAAGTFDTDFVDSVLAVRIQYALVEHEIAQRGLDVGACREEAQSQLADRFVQGDSSGGGQAIIDGFDREYLDYLIDREADFVALQADLSGQPCGGENAEISDEEAQAYFEQHQDEYAAPDSACVSHILVGTLDEANDIRAQLAAGADFATLAEQHSTDTGSAAQGGELGCRSAGQYVAEFAAAVNSQPIGVVGEPVQTQYGYHLILVTSRGVPTLDDVRPEIEAAIRQQAQQDAQQAFSQWFTTKLEESDVELDPRYGTWDPSNARITAPESASSSG